MFSQCSVSGDAFTLTDGSVISSFTFPLLDLQQLQLNLVFLDVWHQNLFLFFFLSCEKKSPPLVITVAPELTWMNLKKLKSQGFSSLSEKCVAPLHLCFSQFETQVGKHLSFFVFFGRFTTDHWAHAECERPEEPSFRFSNDDASLTRCVFPAAVGAGKINCDVILSVFLFTSTSVKVISVTDVLRCCEQRGTWSRLKKTKTGTETNKKIKIKPFQTGSARRGPVWRQQRCEESWADDRRRESGVTCVVVVGS